MVVWGQSNATRIDFFSLSALPLPRWFPGPLVIWLNHLWRIKYSRKNESLSQKSQEKFSSISLALIGPHAQFSSYYCGRWHWMFCLAKLKPHAYLWRCVDWESRGVVVNREILGVEHLLSRSWVVKRQLLSTRHCCSYFIIPNHFIQVTYQTPKQNIPLSFRMSHTLWRGLGLGQNATVMFTRTPRGCPSGIVTPTYSSSVTSSV